MRYVGLLFILFCSVGNQVWATSAGSKITAGDSYFSFGLNGQIDLTKEKDWGLNLSFSHARSTPGTSESKNNLFSAGVDHSFNDDLDDVYGDLVFWRDPINSIQYIGPRGGWTKTFLDSSQKGASSEELFTLSLDAELFVYSAEVDQEITGNTKRRGTGSRTSSVQQPIITQFHPSVSLEKALLDHQLVPFVRLSRYFYSKDPANLESTAGGSRQALRVSGVNAVIGGFLKTTLDAGVTGFLPTQTQLRGEVGVAQSETTGDWFPTLGVSASQKFLDRFRARLGWNHIVQFGEASNYWTLGGTYFF